MSDGPSSAAEQFIAALKGLRQATTAVSYAMLVKQADMRKPPLTINAQRLSDWFRGKAVPADPAVVRFLIEHLQPRATGIPHHPMAWWLDLHQRAVRERQANRDDRGRAADPSPSRRAPRIWRVPTRNASFIGRAAVLTTVRLTLQNGLAPSIAVLHGIGGVGKSSLAVEYAYQHADVLNVVWWVDAEETASAIEQFAALAVELGVTSEQTLAKRAAAEARNWLQRNVGWLVILDNVPSADLAHELIPAGHGRVVITSRDPRWNTIGATIDVNRFSRSESAAVLKERNPAMSDAEADLVAASVDDLPLAVTQAANFISETGMPAGEYVSELETHASDLLDEGRPATYPRSVASVVIISVELLTEKDQHALELLRFSAFLGPDPVPLSWFVVSGQMSQVQLRKAVSRLVRIGLAKHEAADDVLVVHRTTAAIVRDITPAADRHALTIRLQEILVSLRPGAPDETAIWPKWALLAPRAAFLQTVSPDESEEFRQLILDAARYRELAGHASAANDMAARARARWSAMLGEDHTDTMRAAQRQAATLPPAHPDALRIEEDLHERRIRLLGTDHPDTLATANNRAMALADLGRHTEARELTKETLEHQRSLFGPGDSRTLISMDNLANRHSDLGDPQAAKELRDVVLLERLRRLGPNHPDTLRSRIGLARDLARIGLLPDAREKAETTFADASHALGDHHRLTLTAGATLVDILTEEGDTASARQIGEDVLARRRQALGADHPETIASATRLAVNLDALGETAAAESLRHEFSL
ncbi:FxSxx-COOH system tetratricopeptide repeat protein [Actinoplanes subglobosus]|uniref:FxSxx-COOH system tetratricopeptide repeat protein n=1 Tax=Actinoplanes subglobosus TaxID=1547892 RepID=A0ABV8J6C3_9ACTN